MSMMKFLTSSFTFPNGKTINENYRYYFVCFELLESNLKNSVNINFKKYTGSDPNWKLNTILIHSDLFPKFNQLFHNEFNLYFENFTIVLAKTVRQYLEPPIGQCSRYSIPSPKTFDAKSHIQCYRKCFRRLFRNDLNCTLLTLDYSFNMLDFENLDENLCDSDTMYYYNNNYPKLKKNAIEMFVLHFSDSNILSFKY